jgi:glycosyltransferase involved in cell wall biosynthesis
MHIGIIGTRGVPPRYGGFETFAGELGTRLVERGHRVTVYCRAGLYPDATPSWNGVNRIDLPAIPHKYLETVSHTLLSSLDAMRRDFDAVLVCNAANAFVLPLLRAARFPVAINVDGIERERKKWNFLGRTVYFLGESLSVRFATRVVADAEVIADYYRGQFSIDPSVIAYGCDFPDEKDTDILDRLLLEPQRYLLYVSRFEPENNPLEVLRAFQRADVPMPLVMVGDAPYASELVARIRAEAGARVVLPGAIYGADYRTLQRNASWYIQATEVGGTHPALIEAMGSGGAVLALDTPENREVGADAVRYFQFEPVETLSKILGDDLDGSATAAVYRTRARDRARATYNWDRVAGQYEDLLETIAGNKL